MKTTMSLGYPQSILYNQFIDCCERTAQKVSLSDDVVYYMLETCSIVNHENRAFQKLIEWHFDVAGLINKGEAIDVNALDKNPYE